MARVLLATNGLPGLLYASLELARRLAAAGHEVLYASFPQARDAAEDAGFEFLELAPNRYDAFLEADARGSAAGRLLNLGQRRREAVASTGAEPFVRAVRDVAPDLLLIDLELHEHIVATAATGVRMALVNTFVSIWRQPGVPPPHRLVLPGVGWKGSRLVMWLLWRELRLKKLKRAWWHRLSRLGCDRLSVLGGLARDSGFDLRRETDASQWLIPFTYRRVPVLTLHALEFEFRPDVPERVHYVGPMVSERRVDRRGSPEDDARIRKVLEEHAAGGSRRPLVYAGFGSFFTADVALLRRLIGALGDGEADLILSLGGRVDPSALGSLPGGVHAFSWVPQTTVLKTADIAVIHGGINTIDECVTSGVPMLVYCGHENDMGGNTARVVHHGLGIAGDRSRDTPEAIRRHVGRLLHEARFKDTVARFRDLYARYAEERVAERVVGSLLGSTAGDGGRGAPGQGP